MSVTETERRGVKGATGMPGDVDDDIIHVNGAPYVRGARAVELLIAGTKYSPLAAYKRIQQAARDGRIATVQVHTRMKLYREGDVLELRARMLARAQG